MLLDGVVLFILIVWMALGWRAGASLQSVRLGAAVAAFFSAAPLSGVTRQIVFGERAVSTPVVEAASLCIAGVSVYIACRLVGALFVRVFRAVGGPLTWLDHIGGAVLGLLKGALAGYFLVSVVYLGSGALKAVDPEDALQIRESRLLAAVERYNVLVPWQLGSVGELQDALAVGWIAERTDSWAYVRDHPNAADFLGRESVEAMLTDETLVRAAYRGEYAAMVADSDVRACLSHRPCRISLQMVDWGRLRQEIAPTEEPSGGGKFGVQDQSGGETDE